LVIGVPRHPDFFIDGATVEKIPVRRLRWKSTFRIVPSRYPPIGVFERVAGRDDWDLLYDLEGLTNPRLRQEAGEISLVPKARRVSGPGASVVMAPFTHTSTAKPTRFSAGTYGIYYAGHKFETALREVAFHMERFYASTADAPHDETFRTYRGAIDARMHDLRGGSWSPFLDPDPDRYSAPQELGRQLRDSGSNGIVYPSVRHETGECIAVFWPDVIPIPKQATHLMFKWDGKRISAWFDYETEKWADL
jgi:hypothetical protein